MGEEFNQFDDEFDNEFDDESPEPSKVPADLRKALRKAQRENKAMATQLAEITKANRSRTIKEAISAKGLNPKIAAFIPADVEPTDEAVTKWLGEYGDVFSPPSPDAAVEPVEGTPNIDPAELQAQQAMTSLEGTITAPSGLQDFQARLQGAESTEELLKLIAQSG